MRHRRVAAALCGAVALVSLPVVASAQDVAGTNLRAAYVYQMAQFTQWPERALSADGPLVFCVVGDTAVRDALERTVRARQIDDRPLTVAYEPPGRPLPNCHVLYVSAVSTAQASRVVAGLGDAPVLTISDLEGFNKMGGIAEFFYEAGQLRFAVRRDVAARVGIAFSARLLQLARPPR